MEIRVIFLIFIVILVLHSFWLYFPPLFLLFYTINTSLFLNIKKTDSSLVELLDFIFQLINDG